MYLNGKNDNCNFPCDSIEAVARQELFAATTVSARLERRSNEFALSGQFLDYNESDETIGTLAGENDKIMPMKIKVEGLPTFITMRACHSARMSECRKKLLKRLETVSTRKLREPSNWGFLYCPQDTSKSPEDQNLTILERVQRGKFSVQEDMMPRFLTEHKSISSLSLIYDETIELAFCPRFRIRCKAAMPMTGLSGLTNLSAFSLARASIITLQSVFNSPNASLINNSPSSPKTSINLSPQEAKKNLSYSKYKKAQLRFYELVVSKKTEKVAKALDEGYDPNFILMNGTQTPLIAAVENDDTRMMSILIERGGAFPDYRSPDGRTPLHWAALQNKFQAMRYLIMECDINVDAVDDTGMTPLFTACSVGNEQAARMLLMSRADPNACEHLGRSPLYISTYEGHYACVRLCLDYGAMPNTINQGGNTPLHAAACATDANDCAALLLRRGADRTLLNFSAQTAAQMALLAGKFELAALISRFRAEDVVDAKSVAPSADMYGLPPDPAASSCLSSPMSPLKAGNTDQERRKGFVGAGSVGTGIMATLANLRKRATSSNSGTPVSIAKCPPSSPPSQAQNNAVAVAASGGLGEDACTTTSTNNENSSSNNNNSKSNEADSQEESEGPVSAWRYSKVPPSLGRRRSISAAVHNAQVHSKQNCEAKAETPQEHDHQEATTTAASIFTTPRSFIGKNKGTAPSPPGGVRNEDDDKDDGNGDDGHRVTRCETSTSWDEEKSNETISGSGGSSQLAESKGQDQSQRQEIDEASIVDIMSSLTADQHRLFNMIHKENQRLKERVRQLTQAPMRVGMKYDANKRSSSSSSGSSGNIIQQQPATAESTSKG